MEKGITRIPIEDSIVYSDTEEFDSNESGQEMSPESSYEEGEEQEEEEVQEEEEEEVEEEEEEEVQEEESSPVDYGVDLSAFEYALF